MEWQCIGHEPTTWALGKREGDLMANIRARVERLPSGTWRYVIFVSDPTLGGSAPSRALAMAEAEQAWKNHHITTEHWAR